MLGVFIFQPRFPCCDIRFGLLSAAAIGGFMTASRLLPLGLFGLLAYVEPVLLVAVSVLLGAIILPEEIPTYAGAGLAVAILALGGAYALSAGRERLHDMHGSA